MHFFHFLMPFPLKTCVSPKATQSHRKVKSMLSVREYAHFATRAHSHSWRNVARLKANCSRRVNAWRPATGDDPSRKHVPQDSSRTDRPETIKQHHPLCATCLRRAGCSWSSCTTDKSRCHRQSTSTQRTVLLTSSELTRGLCVIPLCQRKLCGAGELLDEWET